MNGSAFRISKGDHRICRPDTWNVDRSIIEPSHKLYLPVSGTAEIWTEEARVEVRSGHFYFFPAYRPMRYSCQAPFELYWMHVDVLDLELELMLSRGPGPCCWPVAEVPFLEEPFRDLRFRGGGLQPSRRVRLEAAALWLLSQVLAEGEGAEPDPEGEERMQRLRPAVVYMNAHYLQSPPLKTVAAQVPLSPEHFHRLFTTLFGITPFQYMLRKRMADALAQLRATADPVSKIGEACGYENPFYFSRTFRRFYGRSPRDARAAARRGET